MAQRDECDDFYAERRERIIEFIKEQLPIINIAQIEGMDFDNCRKLCMQIAREDGLPYEPEHRQAAPVYPCGIDQGNAELRRRLGDTLYGYVAPTPRTQRNPSMVGRAVGIAPRQQRRAWEKPFSHDWSISQMNRLAGTLGEDFTPFVLRHLLRPEQYEKVARVLGY